MAGLNVVTYAAAKAYTDQTVVGGGALKGKNCTVDSITNITGGHRVTFKWTLDNGTVQTGTMDVMDGVDGQDGQDGAPGQDGQDGLTPVITVDEITGGHRITITVGTDVETVDVMDGAKGEDGDPGPAGPGVPAGGSQHQVLRKIDGDDYNTEWADPEGGQTIQVATLPTASSTEEGNIYQYIGDTGSGLINGYFYICEEDAENPGTYKWNAKDVQAGGSGGSSTLAGLDDTDISLPVSEGQVLRVNASGDWENQAFPTIPTTTSQLTNDSNFVADASYVHTDNNFTNAAEDKLGDLPAIKSIGSGLNLNSATGELTATGAAITIDNVIDPTSPNPVENQVIAAALNLKANAADLGTAAVLDVATTGDATTGQVVKGDDSRLTDARTPVAHQHTLSDITDAGSAAALDVPTSGNATTTQVVKGDDSRLTDARNAADVYSWAKDANKPTYTASEVGAVSTNDVGSANGVAGLDSNGKVPAAQLPSYVDDIEEYASESAFPATGTSGKIYVALDTNKLYRWGGSAYAEVSESLALGETSSTAYAGNKGKANADAITAIKDGTSIDSFGDVETALGNKQDTISDLSTIRSGASAGATAYQKPSGGIPGTDLTSAAQTSLGLADSAYQKPSGGIPSTDLTSAAQTSLGLADSAYQKPSGGIPKTDLASAVQTSLDKADGAGYWVTGQDKTINSTSTTSIQFTVPDAGYGYDPYFESADGTPVYVQGENKSGTTLTYTIRALTSAQLPCKAKLLAIPVASA